MSRYVTLVDMHEEALDVPKFSNAKIVSIENAPTITDERTIEFVKLFSQLKPEIQDMMIENMRTLLANQ